MKDFNLSEWALNHRAFTGFLRVLLMGGILAYFQFGFMALLGIIALADMIMRSHVWSPDDCDHGWAAHSNGSDHILPASHCMQPGLESETRKQVQAPRRPSPRGRTIRFPSLLDGRT